MQPLRVYLSSTFEDLMAHRQAVGQALARSGLSVARMEDYVASDQRPLDLCLQDVARCDVFVGIYAWRYGYEPPAAHGNPQARSITHLEYLHAEAQGLRKLLFFAHPQTEAHWPEAFRDALTGQGDGGAKLAQFRQTVGTEKTVSFFRSADELATLVLAAILRSGVSNRLHHLPPLPPGVSARVPLVDAVVAGLVGGGQGPGRHTLIQGAGGFGKTTLALLACHRPELLQAFPDGMLWVSLGETPDLARVLADLVALVSGSPVAVSGVDAIASALARALQGRQCLLVVDDVWREDDLAAFLRLQGPRLLVTTRNRSLVQQASQEPWPEVLVDEMAVDEAGEMLGRGLPVDAAGASALRDLAQRLGCWPLLLDLAAARLRDEHKRGRGGLAQCLAFVTTLFEKKGVLGFDRRDSQARNAAVARSVEAGLELADQLQPGAGLPTRAVEFSVFPENQPIPLQVLAELWGLDDFDLEEEVLRPLDQTSLLRWDRQAGTVALHMMIHRALDARLKAQPGAAAAVHRRLLAAWGDPLQLPHAHAWRWLGWHCLQAGDAPRLRALLLDLDWIQARVRAATTTGQAGPRADLTDLLHDYGLLPGDEALVEVARALRASELVRMWPALLCQQLHGRLAGSALPSSQALAQAALATIRRDEALVPAWAALEPPAAVVAICRNLHDVFTGAPCVLPGGDRALVVRRSDGRSLLLLDIRDDFHLLRELSLPAAIQHVLLLPDGRHALCLCGDASDGGCVEAWRWNLAQGGEPQCLARWDVAGDWSFQAAPGHRRALMHGAAGEPVVLLDLENDCRPIPLAAGVHVDTGVHDTRFSPSGRWAVSWGPELATLQCIDLAHGGRPLPFRLRPPPGMPPDWLPPGPVADLAFGADDDLAVVLLHESNAVLLWRLGQPAIELAWLGWVHWAMPTPDGRHALASDWPADGGPCTVDLLSPRPDDPAGWPDALPRAVAKLEGAPVHRIVSPDGRRLLLAGDVSATVLAWAEAGPPTPVARTRTALRHGGAAWLPDAQRVLLWEPEHRALRCWDTTQQAPPVRLDGLDRGIAGALALGDGQRALTWSDAGTLQLWNLATGQVHWPRPGHDRAVTGAQLVHAGRGLLTVSEDDSCRLWDLHTGQELRQLRVQPPDGIERAIVLRDGARALLCTRKGQVHLVDLSTGQLQAVLHPVHDAWHWSAVDGDDTLVVVSAATPDAVEYSVWRCIGQAELQGRLASRFGASEVGQHLMALDPDGEADPGWQDDALGHQFLPLDANRLLALTVRPILHGEDLVALEHGGWVQDLREPPDRAIVLQFEPWRGEPGLTSDGLEVSADGRWVLSWGPAGLLVAWPLVAPGRPIRLQGHAAAVKGALVLPDGQRVLSWSHDGSLRIWRLHDGQALAVLHSDAGAIQSALLLPSGRHVVTASWQMVCLWDLDAGALLETHAMDAEVTALALHPDGARVVVGDGAGRIQVLQLQLPPG